ncbi:hypothetical protein ACGFT2_23790 [Streptomyces sp. NPDC048514]|uniref:hypothetical protein n=1 Tax=Streptomyces sp. NPDC048514 TaxID=3365564 RepID=UPI003723DC2E
MDPQAVDRIALACSDILANVAPCARSSVLLWVDRRAYTVVLGVRYRGHCPGCPPDTRRGAEATSHEPEFGLRLLTCFVDHWEAATVRGRTTLEAFVRL